MDITEKIQKSVRSLPTLPTVYSALSDEMANPMATNEDIAKIIANDQASSFKVLKVANSPFYGFSGRIETISKAVLHLGFQEVQNIVLALSVINLFSKKKILLNFRPVDFWAHSIAVGVIARMLGNAAGIKNLENYFIAGVLHDIGKLLFFEFVEDEYEEVLKLVEEKNSLIRDAEREVMGIDHAQAGRLLADRWKLPVSIKNAIYHHHEGDIYGRPDLLAATVHIANITARMLELGYAGDDLVPKPNERAWKILNLPPKTFTKMTGFIVRNFEEAVKLVLSN